MDELMRFGLNGVADIPQSVPISCWASCSDSVRRFRGVDSTKAATMTAGAPRAGRILSRSKKSKKENNGAWFQPNACDAAQGQPANGVAILEAEFVAISRLGPSEKSKGRQIKCLRFPATE